MLAFHSVTTIYIVRAKGNVLGKHTTSTGDYYDEKLIISVLGEIISCLKYVWLIVFAQTKFACTNLKQRSYNY